MVINTRAMVAPIRSVTNAMRPSPARRLDAEVLVFDGTELGLLQTGFNRMVTTSASASASATCSAGTSARTWRRLP